MMVAACVSNTNSTCAEHVTESTYCAHDQVAPRTPTPGQCTHPVVGQVQRECPHVEVEHAGTSVRLLHHAQCHCKPLVLVVAAAKQAHEVGRCVAHAPVQVIGRLLQGGRHVSRALGPSNAHAAPASKRCC